MLYPGQSRAILQLPHGAVMHMIENTMLGVMMCLAFHRRVGDVQLPLVSRLQTHSGCVGPQYGLQGAWVLGMPVYACLVVWFDP